MSICDVPPKKIWVTFTHFWGGLGSFLSRLGRFAEYVVRRGKCGSNGESICFGGELSRGKCGSSGQMNHIFRETPRVRKKSFFSEGNPPKYGQIDILAPSHIKFIHFGKKLSQTAIPAPSSGQTDLQTPIWGRSYQLDDQIRNPNVNNRDHLVGRPTR